MKAAKSLFLPTLCLLVLQVRAIANYQMCLECFEENPEEHFYCNAKD